MKPRIQWGKLLLVIALGPIAYVLGWIGWLVMTIASIFPF